MDDVETVAIEDTKEDAASAAIALARANGEAATILVCLSDTGECERRSPGGHGCEFCERIEVDEIGNVSREVMQ